MSEPCSLFAKVHISQMQLDNFFAAPPWQPAITQDWRDWWDTRQMYSKSALTEIPCYANNRVDAWLEDPFHMAFSNYDPAQELWHFGIIQFTENYIEMLPMLALLHHLAAYKKPDDDDFALIFNYFYGDCEVNASIRYSGQTARLNPKAEHKTDIAPAHLQYATDYLDQQWQILSAGMDSGYIE